MNFCAFSPGGGRTLRQKGNMNLRLASIKWKKGEIIIDFQAEREKDHLE